VKTNTKSLEANFSRASKTYDSFARMQKQAADLLLDHLEHAAPEMVDGAVIELGCGTGQMSYGIAQIMQHRKLIFSDISPGMVEMCRKKLSKITSGSRDIHFHVLDAEQLSEKEAYALVFSGLTIQWFKDFQSTLQRIYNALLPGGEFIFSCPVQGSFAEWRSVCDEIQLPCTANVLPERTEMIEQVGAVFDAVDHSPVTIEIDYASAAFFFRSLKYTGTNAQLDGVKLTASQMRRLIRFWDRRLNGGKLTMTYCVDILQAKKKR
jgi:malonyl-CoA O-methyltransferase